MIMQYCNTLHSNDEHLHKDFKLVMFVSFQNKKDGIALPLLNGLKKLVEEKELHDNFRITYRFNDLQTVFNRLPRWDRTYVKT